MPGKNLASSFSNFCDIIRIIRNLQLLSNSNSPSSRIICFQKTAPIRFHHSVLRVCQFQGEFSISSPVLVPNQILIGLPCLIETSRLLPFTDTRSFVHHFPGYPESSPTEHGTAGSCYPYPASLLFPEIETVIVFPFKRATGIICIDQNHIPYRHIGCFLIFSETCQRLSGSHRVLDIFDFPDNGAKVPEQACCRKVATTIQSHAVLPIHGNHSMLTEFSCCIPPSEPVRQVLQYSGLIIFSCRLINTPTDPRPVEKLIQDSYFCPQHLQKVPPEDFPGLRSIRVPDLQKTGFRQQIPERFLLRSMLL